MKGSVQVTENGIPILNKDWGELVDKPSKEWHFIEAFASADAIIDNELNFLFYKKIGVKKTKRRKWLSGLDKASILESKGIIEKELLEKIKRFKKARNFVTHNKEAEYALVIMPGNLQKFNSQEELDSLAEEKAKYWIGVGKEIYDKLGMIFSDLHEEPKEYPEKSANLPVAHK